MARVSKRKRYGLYLLFYFMALNGLGRAQTGDGQKKIQVDSTVTAKSGRTKFNQTDKPAAQSRIDSGSATARSGQTKFNIARLFSNTAGSANDPDYKPRKVAFVLGPGIYYSPSTSIAFTIGGQLFFDAMDKRMTHTDLPEAEIRRIQGRRSNMLIGLNGSALSQFAVGLTPNFYFLNRRLNLKGFFYVGYWPTFFWDIGGDTPDENKEMYNQISNTVDLRLTYDVINGLFLGIGAHYYLYYVLSTTKPGQPAVPSRDMAVGVGPLFSLIYDTRDDNTRPHKGSLINLEMLYNAPIGSYSGHYGKLTMDVRHYFHIPQAKQHIDHVFALNLVANSTVGNNIPFQELPRMGNQSYARGIVSGRFIDRHMMAFQAEYRFYWKWLGFAVFGCAGDVGSTLEEAWHFDKITYGAGLRLKPFKRLPFTIRGDVGFHKKKPQFYIGINELF